MVHSLRAPAPLILRLMLVLALIVGFVQPAAADAYTVRNVRVDATAASAAAARDQALAEAQREALRQLLVRFTGSPAAASRLDAAALVQGYEVQEERTSPVRYVGVITVRFSPQAVRTALTQAGIAYADAESRPVLVLPVLVQGADPVLWEVETPWRSAWNALPAQDGIVPVLVPLGELADATDISADQAMRGDPAGVTAIGQRYNAGSVVVPVVRLPAGATEPTGRFRVEVLRAEVGTASPAGTFTVDVAPGPDPWTRAAEAVHAALEDRWRQDNMIEPGAEGRLTVVVPFANVNEWIEVRRRLAQVPSVTGATLVSMSRNQAVLDLTYRGSPDRLRTVLAQRQLALTQVPGDPVPWRLTVGGPRL